MNASNMTTMQVSLSKVGLGHGIGIAVGILVLVSTVMLASYVCVRVHQARGVGGGNASGGTNSTAPQHDKGSVGGPLGEWLPSGGLDKITVESYLKVAFSSVQHLHDTAYSICLGDYRNGDLLCLMKLLPECRHSFHGPCIDAWLCLHASCPMCRISPLPSPLVTPISTPLSELIPLARHPLGLHSHT